MAPLCKQHYKNPSDNFKIVESTSRYPAKSILYTCERLHSSICVVMATSHSPSTLLLRFRFHCKIGNLHTRRNLGKPRHAPYFIRLMKYRYFMKSIFTESFIDLIDDYWTNYFNKKKRFYTLNKYTFFKE